MNRSDFLELLEESHKKIVALNVTKGNDYAGDEDALKNFKDGGEMLGLSPLVIWHVYFDKHRSAITTFVRDGGVKSEPIEGRILDAILYLYLLLGLVVEGQQSPNISVRSPREDADADT